ncbi:hypothetical protein PMIN06_011426 [Paraphaeosphaeria minitans]|uniref:Uncharacterized protein n=1 Tax=Paraphaeosphaeria minitans TaxID=565426 RepID=A0A9P6G8G8_9PLEO|nr:hypothetical protein PMIN01_11264 [Paraphaeosphaeria minitans]
MNPTIPPPPYTMQPQQLLASTPAPMQNAFSQMPEKEMYGQAQPQQPPNYVQSLQGYPAQPSIQQPVLQQPLRYPPNMTPQQQQQVQQIVRNLPPEKLQLYQQQAQQMMSSQQSMSPSSFQQPQ